MMGATPSIAGTIAYSDVGHVAAPHSFLATQTGEIDAFFAGSTASYDETLGFAVNGVVQADGLLDNHATSVGTAVGLGNVQKGDVLTFFIDVSTTGDSFSSDSSRNRDGVNHVYSRSYAATNGPSGGAAMPSGTFVAFEDLQGGGDLNYNDETFVFTNTSTLDTGPLPAAGPMLGAALMMVGAVGFGVKRRRSAWADGLRPSPVN